MKNSLNLPPIELQKQFCQKFEFRIVWYEGFKKCDLFSFLLHRIITEADTKHVQEVFVI